MQLIRSVLILCTLLIWALPSFSAEPASKISSTKKRHFTTLLTTYALWESAWQTVWGNDAIELEIDPEELEAFLDANVITRSPWRETRVFLVDSVDDISEELGLSEEALENLVEKAKTLVFTTSSIRADLAEDLAWTRTARRLHLYWQTVAGPRYDLEFRATERAVFKQLDESLDAAWPELYEDAEALLGGYF